MGVLAEWMLLLLAADDDDDVSPAVLMVSVTFYEEVPYHIVGMVR